MKLWLWMLIFSTAQTGCNYNPFAKASTVVGQQKFAMTEEKISQLSFALVTDRVFAPQCISCHGSSGGVSLRAFDAVKANIRRIEQTVFVEGSMPKDSRLSEEQMAYLWNWIRIGAPEFAQDGGVINPPDPIQPTFNSIDKNIFQVTCVKCHRPDGTGKRILLDKVSLLTSPLELVIPSNSDESGLVIALERGDDKRMPPEDEGYSALTDEEKMAVRKWIENGASD